MLEYKKLYLWQKEENECRERIALKRLTDKNFDRLKNTPYNYGKRRLRSVHNYDILANPIY